MLGSTNLDESRRRHTISQTPAYSFRPVALGLTTESDIGTGSANKAVQSSFVLTDLGLPPVTLGGVVCLLRLNEKPMT